MTSRRCRNRRPGTFRKQTLLRGFLYKGFIVEVWNNNYWGFRYEWKLRPVTELAKHSVDHAKVVHDPTSSRTRKVAKLYGKFAAADSISSLKPTW